MKKLSNILIIFLFTALAVFTGCKKDDPDGNDPSGDPPATAELFEEINCETLSASLDYSGLCMFSTSPPDVTSAPITSEACQFFIKDEDMGDAGGYFVTVTVYSTTDIAEISYDGATIGLVDVDNLSTSNESNLGNEARFIEFMEDGDENLWLQVRSTNLVFLIMAQVEDGVTTSCSYDESEMRLFASEIIENL